MLQNCFVGILIVKILSIETFSGAADFCGKTLKRRLSKEFFFIMSYVFFCLGQV